jgi:AbrB family looped-hinge helix DNA binding protein
MSTTMTLDKAGRVVIPKNLRDELRLAPGDSLAIESDGENMLLRPIRSSSVLRKKRGIWVFYGEQKISSSETDRALESLRHERDLGALGEKT